ncbi:GTP pyrophosphokinase [Bacillus thuringiensis]|nr:GTP pyrophosphokinase [Bacillus thuringiensis]
MLPSYIKIAHEIAKKAHAGQVNKAGIDYIKHPEAVASFVNTAEEKATAYLHAVLEDTEITTVDLLNAGILHNVVEAVQVLTKEKYTPYFEYLSKVKENSLARTVKLADLEHNPDGSRFARITDKDLKRLEKYRKARISRMIKGGKLVPFKKMERVSLFHCEDIGEKKELEKLRDKYRPHDED